MTDLTIQDILTVMPHRYPFLLIDKVTDIVPAQSGRGVKNVTINEPFFQGHFPNNPVMPGVLQIEAMAQTAGAVIVSSMPKDACKQYDVLFMTIDAVKFRKPVMPGDTLILDVKKTQEMRNIYKFVAKAYVGDKVVSEATFSAMITPKQ